MLAALEVADGTGARVKGLLGRDGMDGALLLKPAKSVHTLGMRFAIDVAYCDNEFRVIDVCTMRPNRMGLPRPKAHSVIEAEEGAFERWRLRVGDHLEIKGE